MHNYLWAAIGILILAAAFGIITLVQGNLIGELRDRIAAVEAREVKKVEVLEGLLRISEANRQTVVEGYDRCAIGWLIFNSDFGPVEGQAAYCYTAKETHFGESTERTQPSDTNRGGTQLRREAPSRALGVFNEGLRGEPSLWRVPSSLSDSLRYPEAGVQGK